MSEQKSTNIDPNLPKEEGSLKESKSFEIKELELNQFSKISSLTYDNYVSPNVNAKAASNLLNGRSVVKSPAGLLTDYLMKFDSSASCYVRGETKDYYRTYSITSNNELKSCERALKTLCNESNKKLSYDRVSDRGEGMSNIVLKIEGSISVDELEKLIGKVSPTTNKSRAGALKGR